MFKRIKELLCVTKSQNDESARDHFSDCDVNEFFDHGAVVMDIPGSLPLEILYEILLYLPPHDLHSMWKCCRKWRNNMAGFWKKKCLIEGYFECEDDLNSEFYRKFVAKYSKWEGIYLYNSILEKNWTTQNFKEVIVNCKLSKIPPFDENKKYFFGDVLIVILRKNNIMVIDCTTGCVKQRFCLPDLKNKCIWIAQIGKFGNQLIVVSEVNTFFKPDPTVPCARTVLIKVWNIETGSSMREFQMGTDYMVKIEIYRNLVTLLTYSNTANIINIKRKKLVYQRSGITSAFHCSDKIAMGTNEGAVIIMNSNYAELTTLNCFDVDRRVDDIEINGNYLIGFSRNENTHLFSACIFDIEAKTKLYSIDRLWRDGLKIFPIKNKLIYMCPDTDSFRATLKYCRLDSGECILQNYYEKITNLTSNDFFILYESPRGLFNLWSIKSQNAVANLCLPDPTFIWSHEVLKAKSKLAYFNYDVVVSYDLHRNFHLKIINFEAAIEI